MSSIEFTDCELARAEGPPESAAELEAHRHRQAAQLKRCDFQLIWIVLSGLVAGHEPSFPLSAAPVDLDAAQPKHPSGAHLGSQGGVR